MGSPFRDGLGAQAELLRDLDRRIAELEARLTPFFWDEVAPAVGLEPTGALPSPPRRPDLATLGRLVALREARLAALEAVTRDLDRLEAEWHGPAPALPPLVSPEVAHDSAGWGPPKADEGVAAFRRAVARHAPGARLEEVVGPGYRGVADLASESGPLQIVMEKQAHEGSVVQSTTVRGTVSRLHGPLRIAPEGCIDPLLVALGLRKEVQVGHAELDGLFLVQAEPDVARALVTEAVRAALLALIREATPTLELGRGLATLRWTGAVGPALVGLALEAIESIRRAPPTRPLRR